MEIWYHAAARNLWANHCHANANPVIDPHFGQDLFIGNTAASSNTNVLFLGDGSGGFTQVAGGPATDISEYPPVMADVDNDGDLDILISQSIYANKIWLNGALDGAGLATVEWTASSVGQVGGYTGASYTILADFNGDVRSLVSISRPLGCPRLLLLIWNE